MGKRAGGWGRAEGGLVGEAEDEGAEARVEVVVDEVGDGEADGGCAEAGVEALERGSGKDGRVMETCAEIWLAPYRHSRQRQRRAAAVHRRAFQPSCCVIWSRAGSIELGREALTAEDSLSAAGAAAACGRGARSAAHRAGTQHVDQQGAGPMVCELIVLRLRPATRENQYKRWELLSRERVVSQQRTLSAAASA